MHPDNEIEEALMIAAFNRRQQIEALKIATLITATVNPDKAHESYMSLLSLMLPGYGEVRQNMDVKMLNAFEKEKSKAFSLGNVGGAYRATQINLEDIDA